MTKACIGCGGFQRAAGQGILPRLPSSSKPPRRTWPSGQGGRTVPSTRRTAAIGLVLTVLTLAATGCGDSGPGPSAASPSASASGPAFDLSAIGCATDDPTDAGELTGAWQGDDSGVYYIRQVGDCVWWFGTELRDIEPGVTGQPGFANVASGRVIGSAIEVEWADVPMGNILNGGGLTLVYDEQKDRLVITERRGNGEPFGATTFSPIGPGASPEASPKESASSPSSSTTAPSMGAADLSAIACATADPGDAGELTDAWSGTDGGVYYIRQVGDCVWWFGTGLREIRPGVTGQGSFTNVASGRINGSEIELQWADVPMGNAQNGGGITLTYDSQHEGLVIIERNGEGSPFGAQAFSRIEPPAVPEATPSESASP